MRDFTIAIIAAVGFAVLGFFSFGLAALPFAVVADPVVSLLRGTPGSNFDGDRALGLGILFATVIPPTLPLLYWGIGRIWPHMNRWLVAGVTLLASWVIAIAVLYAMTGPTP